MSCQGRPSGPGTPLGVELPRDCPRALAGRKLTKDPADDGGFGLVDAPRAGAAGIVGHDAVAVGASAGGAALQHPAEQAAPGLVPRSDR